MRENSPEPLHLEQLKVANFHSFRLACGGVTAASGRQRCHGDAAVTGGSRARPAGSRARRSAGPGSLMHGGTLSGSRRAFESTGLGGARRKQSENSGNSGNLKAGAGRQHGRAGSPGLPMHGGKGVRRPGPWPAGR